MGNLPIGKNKDDITLIKFLKYIENITSDDDIFESFMREEELYYNVPEIKKLNSILREDSERMFFYLVASMYLFEYRVSKLKTVAQIVYPFYSNYFFECIESFKNNEHILQKLDLVELNSDFIIDEVTLELTQKGIELLLGDKATFFTSS